MDSFRTRSVCRHLGQVLTTAALVCLAAPAFATTLVGVDVPELTDASDSVVRGKVQKVESAWSGDGMQIFTEVEITVDETLKGSDQRTVKVVQPGGSVGDIGQRVDGMASFQKGEDVVVFLEKQGSRSFQLSGMAQGKYRIEKSSDGKDTFAVPEPLGEVRLVDRATMQTVASTRQALNLNTLRKNVRERVALKKQTDTAKPKAPRKAP